MKLINIFSSFDGMNKNIIISFLNFIEDSLEQKSYVLIGFVIVFEKVTDQLIRRILMHEYGGASIYVIKIISRSQLENGSFKNISTIM